MTRDAEKRARAEAMLGELAELAMMLARDLAAQAGAAEDAEEKVALATAFQKTSRAVRLTLALDFRLQREAETAERAAARAGAEAAEEAKRAAKAAAAPRKRRIYAALERLIWTEGCDEEHAAYLASQLEELMDEDDLSGLYAEGAVEAHVTRLAVTLGLCRPGDEVLVFPTREAAAYAGYVFDAAPPLNSS